MKFCMELHVCRSIVSVTIVSFIYFSFCVFLCFLCTTASTTITTRMMKHPATPAATDEAIMTTLLEVLGGGGVVGGVSALLIEAWVGGGVIGRVSAAPIEGWIEGWISEVGRGDALGEGGRNKVEDEEGERRLQFSEGILSSGSTGWRRSYRE